MKTLLDRTKQPHQKSFLMMELFTGMRHTEILTLEREDVFLKEKYIKLKVKNTQTKKSRIIPIVSTLYDWLSEVERESDYVVSCLGNKKDSLGNKINCIGWDYCYNGDYTPGLGDKISEKHNSDKTRKDCLDVIDDYCVKFKWGYTKLLRLFFRKYEVLKKFQ